MKYASTPQSRRWFAALAVGLSCLTPTLSQAAEGPARVGVSLDAEARQAALDAAKAGTKDQHVQPRTEWDIPNRFPVFGGLKKSTKPKMVDLLAKLSQQSARQAAVANMPSVLKSFSGYANSDNQLLAGGLVAPPDTNGDVGLNHYVQYVNIGWVAFNKSDGSVAFGPKAGNYFWQGFGGICESDNAGDPIVLYDHLADRWVFSQFTTSDVDGHQCFAVSQGSNPFPPAGTAPKDYYHRYDFRVSPGGMFNDYPKIGLWPNGYYMTTNEFGASFVGVNINVFDRTAMLSGQTAQFVQWDLGAADTFSAQPGHLEGYDLPPAGTCNTVLHASDREVFDEGTGPDKYRVWQVCPNFANPALSQLNERTSVVVTPFDANLCNFAGCAPQPGTGTKLDTLAQFTMYRYTQRFFPGEGLRGVVSHSVDVGSDRGGIRWTSLNIDAATGNTSLREEGTHAPADGKFRWMPAAGMDAMGNIAVIYSRSSSAEFPSIVYSGRETGDAAATLQTEASCVAGTGSQTGTSRWGDYASLSIDPVDQCTFWGTSEYMQTTSSRSWNTRVCAFRFPSCSDTATFTLAATQTSQKVCSASGANLAPVALSTAAVGGYSGSATLSYGPLPAGFSGNFTANPIAVPGASVAQLAVTNSVATGIYNLMIKANAPGIERSAALVIDVSQSVTAAPVLQSPAAGANGVSPLTLFEWDAVADADEYRLLVDDNADFSSPVVNVVVSQNRHTLSSALAPGKQHYWKVLALNACGESVASPARSFTTGVEYCASPNLGIPDNNPAGVMSSISISDPGSISQLNVSLKATHTWVGDLKFSLTHVPSGTTVDLVDRPRRTTSGFGCSADNIDSFLTDFATRTAETACNSTPPALSGDLRPNQSLATFNGKSVAGQWKLVATDTEGGDIGVLQKWCVVVNRPIPSAQVGDFNADGCIDVKDMAMLLDAIRTRSTDMRYDLNKDGRVSTADRPALVALYTNPNGASCN